MTAAMVASMTDEVTADTDIVINDAMQVVIPAAMTSPMIVVLKCATPVAIKAAIMTIITYAMRPSHLF